ncbi:hypothetical protein [Baaleninema sp.]|uniref:hypothetical protein n=1 Tax=Baaleninema sp. TaxID=3101197 RepID=UPI003D040CDA
MNFSSAVLDTTTNFSQLYCYFTEFSARSSASYPCQQSLQLLDRSYSIGSTFALK